MSWSRSRWRRRSRTRASSRRSRRAWIACSRCSRTGDGTATFSRLTELLARGALGDVTHFESHFDRYRPHVRDRWRERAGVGSGIWYDLGPHLVDQALQLFGLPDRVMASMAAQRAGAQSDDWAHVVLEYSRLRVILHASMLVAAPLPRFIVHGHAGSWIKYGLDAQERQLNAALTPDAAGQRPGRANMRCLSTAGAARKRRRLCRAETTGEFYLRLRDALQGTGTQPCSAGTGASGHGCRRDCDPIVSRGRALPSR